MLYDATGERAVEVADLAKAKALPGRHNWQNAAAAYAAAISLGVSPADAAMALLSFPGLAHRMENVGQIGRVRFINDSKATNADAARQAMAATPNFYWIAGGVPKAGGVEPLRDLFPKIAQAYLLGDAAPHSLCGDLERAVTEAYRDAAASGEDAVILLSPACASFDQFPDFEVRGDAFRKLVAELATATERVGA
jgi:UDP-N-acetylmuramoylalanine--D-glutamate ligase